MMGSQDLMGMQEVSRGQLEMESRNELDVTPVLDCSHQQ